MIGRRPLSILLAAALAVSSCAPMTREERGPLCMNCAADVLKLDEGPGPTPQEEGDNWLKVQAIVLLTGLLQLFAGGRR